MADGTVWFQLLQSKLIGPVIRAELSGGIEAFVVLLEVGADPGNFLSTYLLAYLSILSGHLGYRQDANIP